MGVYLNPGADLLRRARASRIYVDKSELLVFLNSVVETEQSYVCVSRPRRFGKSMAANMVCAYYDRTVDTVAEFAGMDIANDPSFEKGAGRYDVVRINMQEFLSATHDVQRMLDLFCAAILREIKREYSDLDTLADVGLPFAMADIYAQTGRKFVIVIDEWDCPMREMQGKENEQRLYLDFLRLWLKDRPYVALCYMTGILPIKKYGTHSALNMFSEFSMTEPRQLALSMGFTDDEVRELCEAWRMPYAETRAWYDGYSLVHTSAPAPGTDPVRQKVEIYSPRSIVEAMTSHAFGDYWNRTETYEALKIYLEMNYDGLRDAVIALLAGGRRKINTATFVNDMTTFATADDVLTLLVHLGYLAYDQEASEVYVPNHEVAREFEASVISGGWDEVARAIKGSEALLDAIVAGDEAAVAAGVEAAHQETSHLTYNDENALAYTLSLGLYAAREYYTVVRELPAGKGFADLVLIPRRAFADRPAIVAELKWDRDVEAAISQIHDKRYPEVLAQWVADGGEVILAGVSYDKKTREHTCKIERVS